MKVRIEKGVIEDVLLYSSQAYPKEFFSFLKGEIKNEEILVKRVYYHPSVSSKKHVMLLPSIGTNHHGMIGTAHSHPNDVLTPSKADLKIFSEYPVNFIIGKDRFRVFNNEGKELIYEIIEGIEKRDDIERMHAKIFFEAIEEKKMWHSMKTNFTFVAISAVIMTILFVSLLFL